VKGGELSLQIITTRPSRAEPGKARQTFKNAMIQGIQEEVVDHQRGGEKARNSDGVRAIQHRNDLPATAPKGSVRSIYRVKRISNGKKMALVLGKVIFIGSGDSWSIG
jgi:hypothetical protein